ncbi:hypothetical protein EXQ44_15175 [Clostridium botulinum]|nr:hypothetical protein [Clostridium botulinum]
MQIVVLDIATKYYSREGKIISILTISKNNKVLIRTSKYKKYQHEQFKFKDIKIQLLNDRVLHQNKNFMGYNEDKSMHGFIIGEIYDLKVGKLKEAQHKSNTTLDSKYIVHLYEENSVLYFYKTELSINKNRY